MRLLILREVGELDAEYFPVRLEGLEEELDLAALMSMEVFLVVAEWAVGDIESSAGGIIEFSAIEVYIGRSVE